MSKRLPLVRLPSSTAIFKLGTPTTASRHEALLRFPSEGWTVDQEVSKGQGWAIVGDAEGRKAVVEVRYGRPIQIKAIRADLDRNSQTLLSRHRIHPIIPPPGPFPYISHLSSSQSTPANSGSSARLVRHLGFARPPTSGEFTDYTARYGALQEEDKLSFRETLSALHPPPTRKHIEEVARTMQIDQLLDFPAVSLSSGQTRRARIAAALLTKPVLLLLEDPMAGLDMKSREQVSQILGRVNAEGERRIVLVLRGKGGSMPKWITDVCEVKNGDVWIGSRVDYERRKSDTEDAGRLEVIKDDTNPEAPLQAKEPVVALEDVSISYGEGSRPVRSACMKACASY